MKSPGLPIFLFIGLILLVTLSCTVSIGSPPASQTPQTNAITPTLPIEIPTAGSPAAQSNPEPPSTVQESTPTSIPQEEPALLMELENCPDDVCILDGAFFLKRPIGSTGRNVIDATSRYGTLRRRIRDAYHGVQFLNSTGTPVYAAAAGDVEVAGNDSQVYYGPRPDMYGNLVILKHTLPGIPEPVYTLYANLSDVLVKAEGDVEAGEQIGSVGMSGSVRGSTLGFEVRYGDNIYDAAVNPELWLEPVTDETGDPTGVLAGKVINQDGVYVPITNIQIENLRTATGGKLRPIYLRTYLESKQLGLSPWGESFAAGDLPEGTYQISFWYGPNQFQREVEIQPGKLTFVTFRVK